MFTVVHRTLAISLAPLHTDIHVTFSHLNRNAGAIVGAVRSSNHVLLNLHRMPSTCAEVPSVYSMRSEPMMMS